MRVIGRGCGWLREKFLSGMRRSRGRGMEAEAERRTTAVSIGRGQRKGRENGGQQKKVEATRKGLGGGCGKMARRGKKMRQKTTNEWWAYRRWGIRMTMFLAVGSTCGMYTGQNYGTTQQDGVWATPAQYRTTLGRTATTQENGRRKENIAWKQAIVEGMRGFELGRVINLGREGRVQWDTVGRLHSATSTSTSVQCVRILANRVHLGELTVQVC